MHQIAAHIATNCWAGISRSGKKFPENTIPSGVSIASRGCCSCLHERKIKKGKTPGGKSPKASDEKAPEQAEKFFLRTARSSGEEPSEAELKIWEAEARRDRADTRRHSAGLPYEVDDIKLLLASLFKRAGRGKDSEAVITALGDVQDILMLIVNQLFSWACDLPDTTCGKWAGRTLALIASKLASSSGLKVEFVESRMNGPLAKNLAFAKRLRDLLGRKDLALRGESVSRLMIAVWRKAIGSYKDALFARELSLRLSKAERKALGVLERAFALEQEMERLRVQLLSQLKLIATQKKSEDSDRAGAMQEESKGRGRRPAWSKPVALFIFDELLATILVEGWKMWEAKFPDLARRGRDLAVKKGIDGSLPAVRSKLMRDKLCASWLVIAGRPWGDDEGLELLR